MATPWMHSEEFLAMIGRVIAMRGLWPGEDIPPLPEPSYREAVRLLKDGCLWCGRNSDRHFGRIHLCVSNDPHGHTFTRRGEFRHDGQPQYPWEDVT